MSQLRVLNQKYLTVFGTIVILMLISFSFVFKSTTINPTSVFLPNLKTPYIHLLAEEIGNASVLLNINLTFSPNCNSLGFIAGDLAVFDPCLRKIQSDISELKCYFETKAIYLGETNKSNEMFDILNFSLPLLTFLNNEIELMRNHVSIDFIHKMKHKANMFGKSMESIQSKIKKLNVSFKAETQRVLSQNNAQAKINVAFNASQFLNFQLHSLHKEINSIRNQEEISSIRDNKIKQISTIAFQHIVSLQSPPDCNKAKIMICDFDNKCGFGCFVHWLATCFARAYSLNRTVIFDKDNLKLSKTGWEDAILPISTCSLRSINLSSIAPWEDVDKDPQIIKSNIKIFEAAVYSLIPVPEEFTTVLYRHHGNPHAWWIGQIMSYIIRPNSKTIESFHSFMSQQELISGRYLGIHVRRTDKLEREAEFYPINSYMDRIIHYLYDVQETANFTHYSNISDKNHPIIYIASDDPSVFNQARNLYPTFNFRDNKNISAIANLKTRTSAASLKGILQDIWVLSRASHVVCTFSSNVCRTVYELMQALHTDASMSVDSLDRVYYYFKGPQKWRAAISHTPQLASEIDIREGDDVDLEINHWKGFATVNNKRTAEKGLVPLYKLTKVLSTPYKMDPN